MLLDYGRDGWQPWGLFDDFCFDTLFKASLLRTFLAFSIAELIMSGLYSLDKSKSLSSKNLFSLSSLKMQILLKASEYEISGGLCQM